ncbi:DDE-type integrase/transposase/recombinase [Candidatus Bathyarchaeota archaeon]|nr:DDE-type integrase/transposase/recombinase [Candidatus Bathyarchaeota archaeon]
MDSSRELRGKAIAQLEGQINRLSVAIYQVKSQSGNGPYLVRSNEKGWTCTCPDHLYREVKCKHIWACELSYAIRKKVEAHVVTIQPVNTLICPACSSGLVVKDALRHNKYGMIQRYLCKDCGKRFSFNLGFDKMKARPEAITSALQLYFTGESLRNVQKFLRLQGVNVSHVSIYKWIQKYVGLMENYLKQITPQLSDTWRADEMWMKFKGNPKYLYALLDDETRFWIAKEVAGDKFSKEAADYASKLLSQGKQIAGKTPLTLITDGLHAYHLAWKREIYSNRQQQAKHIEHVAWRANGTDNRKMERFNGEIRDREKVMRGLKREGTSILTGYQIYHNYIRPHEALEGRTPAEASGIKIEGKNKWLTLIQNASSKNSCA